MRSTSCRKMHDRIRLQSNLSACLEYVVGMCSLRLCIYREVQLAARAVRNKQNPKYALIWQVSCEVEIQGQLSRAGRCVVCSL